jgi:riboflavin kinase / FMN adenylyltransferase
MTQWLYHSIQELPQQRHVLTIGSFDGVHRGHQHLLTRVADRARQVDISSLAITFDPLPAEVLRPDKAPTRLCTTRDRTGEIHRCSIDHVVLLTFDDDVAHLTADEFLNTILEHAQPSVIVVGEDFAFGHKRQGTPEFLAYRADQDGFGLEVVERVNPVGIELSSSAVRRALVERGDVQAAREILGRRYRLSGRVKNGNHRGRDLGYPTANLALIDRLTLPADGIYAALVAVDASTEGTSRPALVYIGTRPTFGESARIAEVFLLDFEGDLYGEKLAVDFVDRIRGDRHFDSAEQLVEQMQRDEAAGREIFNALGIGVASPER